MVQFATKPEPGMMRGISKGWLGPPCWVDYNLGYQLDWNEKPVGNQESIPPVWIN
jgi:hypothetical protein